MAPSHGVHIRLFPTTGLQHIVDGVVLAVLAGPSV